METNKSREKGQTIIIVALMITILLLFVGLAIDSGIGYGVKAKLSSAVDAAALAAGKALGDPAADDASRITHATSVAQTFFAANFPNGYLMATPTPPTIVIVHDPSTGRWNITVTATATEPTIFLKIGGRKTFTAQAVAGAVRRDLDMAFVLDTTGSLAPVFPTVQTDAIAFINNFIESSDRVALVHFAYGAVVDVPIRTAGRGFNKASMVSDISTFSASGNTNFSEAFWRARFQLDSILPVDRSSLRAIVFFSDGSPNSFSSTFPSPCAPPSNTGVIITGDSPGSPSGLSKTNSVSYVASGCSASSVTSMPAFFNVENGLGGNTFHVTSPPSGPGLNPRPVTSTPVDFYNVNNAARNLAEEMANNARDAGIFVYTIGLGTLLTTPISWGNLETGDTVLRNMANDPLANTYNRNQPTGLYCFAPTIADLQPCFDMVASKILRLTK